MALYGCSLCSGSQHRRFHVHSCALYDEVTSLSSASSFHSLGMLALSVR